MPIPNPEPSLVISYAYLWHREHQAGQEDGRKDRPSVIVLAIERQAGGALGIARTEFDIRAQFEWQPIGRVALDQERRLAFPRAPSSPGLYRFRLLKDGREARYIGETDNISRRFAHYRNPGPSQETNLRINARFLQALIDGAEISVAMVTDGVQVDSGEGFGPVDLKSKTVRRLLENAALVECGGIDIEMLNRAE